MPHSLSACLAFMFLRLCVEIPTRHAVSAAGSSSFQSPPECFVATAADGHRRKNYERVIIHGFLRWDDSVFRLWSYLFASVLFIIKSPRPHPPQNELLRISSILKYAAVTNALCLQQKAGMMQKNEEEEEEKRKEERDLVVRSHEAVAMKYLSITLSVRSAVAQVCTKSTAARWVASVRLLIV